MHDSNAICRWKGKANFKGLKKGLYAQGVELRGKTLGVIGFGRIGQEAAKGGLGVGMHVIAADKFMDKATVDVALFNGQSIRL